MTFIIAICLLVSSHNIQLALILSDSLIWNYTKVKKDLRYVNICPTMQLFPLCNLFGSNSWVFVLYNYTRKSLDTTYPE